MYGGCGTGAGLPGVAGGGGGGGGGPEVCEDRLRVPAQLWRGPAHLSLRPRR